MWQVKTSNRLIVSKLKEHNEDLLQFNVFHLLCIKYLYKYIYLKGSLSDAESDEEGQSMSQAANNFKQVRATEKETDGDETIQDDDDNDDDETSDDDDDDDNDDSSDSPSVADKPVTVEDMIKKMKSLKPDSDIKTSGKMVSGSKCGIFRWLRHKRSVKCFLTHGWDPRK